MQILSPPRRPMNSDSGFYQGALVVHEQKSILEALAQVSSSPLGLHTRSPECDEMLLPASPTQEVLDVVGLGEAQAD